MPQDNLLLERGLLYWMNEVVAQIGKTRDGFKADPVHDLRVAIRRCRAIGQGFATLDPHPYWGKMRKYAKPIFAALGELRDVHVLVEWIQKLSVPEDPVVQKLMTHCKAREQELKTSAAAQLAAFDADQWLKWAGTLEERSNTIPLDEDVFLLMALERWSEAHTLHSTALRNRSKIAMHELRIGIKKFRYIVENFLPELHDLWKQDLKRVQDLLGEVHDLDVLWDTAKAIQAFASPQQRQQWLAAIKRERAQRVDEYRSKAVGRDSLWHVWRSRLPEGETLHCAVMEFFETWAFYRDPDLSHTHRVLDMSLAVFEQLNSSRLIRITRFEGVSLKDLLTVTVLTHECGRGARRKYNKEVVHRLLRLTPPPGWTLEHLKVVGLAARYQAGALPSVVHTQYAGMKKSARRIIDLLAGILRLGESLDADRSGKVQRIYPTMNDGHLLIDAVGYEERSALAEHVAAARYLLESVCKIPIVVRATQAQEA